MDYPREDLGWALGFGQAGSELVLNPYDMAHINVLKALELKPHHATPE